MSRHISIIPQSRYKRTTAVTDPQMDSAATGKQDSSGGKSEDSYTTAVDYPQLIMPVIDVQGSVQMKHLEESRMPIVEKSRPRQGLLNIARENLRDERNELNNDKSIQQTSGVRRSLSEKEGELVAAKKMLTAEMEMLKIKGAIKAEKIEAARFSEEKRRRIYKWLENIPDEAVHQKVQAPKPKPWDCLWEFKFGI